MPTKFVDNAGNEFVLTFSYGLFRAIRNEIGIDAANPNDIPKLLNSPVDLIQFAFCVCRNKCKQLGISESEFELNLEGENTLNDLSEAVFTELANFTERFGQKLLATNLRTAAEAIRELNTTETE